MRTFLIAAALCLSGAAASRADFIDTFNTENSGLGQLNYNSFANWTVANATSAGGTVDLIGNGFFDFYPGNGLNVDLLGSGNGVPGLLTTKQTFAAGTYTLSFDLAGSDRGVDNHVIINFGTFSQILFLPSTQGYTLFTDQVTLTTAAKLSFQNQESGVLGAILDNVSVVTNATTVPEPSSMTLCVIASVVGLGVARRRRLAAWHGPSAELIHRMLSGTTRGPMISTETLPK